MMFLKRFAHWNRRKSAMKFLVWCPDSCPRPIAFQCPEKCVCACASTQREFASPSLKPGAPMAATAAMAAMENLPDEQRDEFKC